MTNATESDLRAMIARLTIDDEAALVRGANGWQTCALDGTAGRTDIGLSPITMSDGPTGVRGLVWDERQPSISFPSGSMLGATWDPELAYRYGAATAAEARRKGVSVVLGPTINLHRSPLGGRHFECFSEDPRHTGMLAAAYVRGLQAGGVAACPKHFVGNDSETERFSVDVVVDARTLRELYLWPFEQVVAAGTWAVMSSYNAVNGTTMTENDLLRGVLKGDWGFDGVVISDWLAVRSLASARAEQDLAMPGPVPAWEHLAEAVHRGDVERAALERKVSRLLRLADRVGSLGTAGIPRQTPGPIDPALEAFAREVAAEGMVLLANDGVLPLNAGTLTRVAIIGQNARDARTQGGGSATVVPAHVISPLDGITAALPGVAIDYALGAVVDDGVIEFPPATMTNPVTGATGLHVTFFGPKGDELFAEDRLRSTLVWLTGDIPAPDAASVVIETTYVPEVSGPTQIGFAGATPGQVWLDDAMLVDAVPVLDPDDLGAAFMSPPSFTSTVTLVAGRQYHLRAEFPLSGTVRSALGVTLGRTSSVRCAEDLITEAVTVAKRADVAIVVVGTNAQVESEGHDRSDLRLPGAQDDMVAAVAGTGTPVVAVVNAGSPVELPWAGDVAAIIQGFFGGQEFGAALADVLFGITEPGGRLPTTWPRTLAEVPVSQVQPSDGKLRYEEGLDIGYRAWLRAKTEPAFAFGHGLGYTQWSWDSAELTDDGASLQVQVSNTGERPGKAVVQVYAERVSPSEVRYPVRWLVGSAVVRADPGVSSEAIVALDDRTFSHWDESSHGWTTEPGRYRLYAGASVVDLPLSLDLTI